MQQAKHVHFIGICGVGMSAIAIALHKNGWRVTGSDKGFFPPVSTNLQNAGISFYPGWHPEKMSADGNPDMVIVGNASGGDKNPEFQYVKENNIPYYSYPAFLGKYFVKPESIVISGTWGKTSSVARLAVIMQEAGMDSSYMLGGVPIELAPAHLATRSPSGKEWSIMEGDEYTSARFDQKAKFSHYKAKYLMLTAVSHDHFDKYPTEESYFKAFEDLVASIPTDGVIFASPDEGVVKVIQNAKCKIIKYGASSDADYRLENLTESQDGIEFDIVHDNKTHHIKSPILGGFQAENIAGCFAVAHDAGIKPEIIIKAISKFKGLKKRLEKRIDGPVSVIDEHAHSPEKVLSAMKTLRKVYSGKIIMIYEPNIGNLRPEAKPKYKEYAEGFKMADEIIIPRLSKIKVDPAAAPPMTGQELTGLIKQTNPNTRNIDDDKELVEYITQGRKEGDVVAFMSGHGFRGMIEEVVEKLE